MDISTYEFLESGKVTSKRNFSKGRYDDLNSYFNRIDWTGILSGANLEDSYKVYKEIISDAIEKFVPLEQYKHKYSVPI